MKQNNIRNLLVYELIGIIFIIFLGSAMHFTFELSGGQSIVGIFSSVNESVWEHLKLAYWPTLLYAISGYFFLKNQAINLFPAKALGAGLMILIIPAIFYGYTSITCESIFVVDIASFIFAVIIGQAASYKVMTYKKLPLYLNIISISFLALLAIIFALFTFYPPRWPIFQDAVTGKYGIIE